jgi:hypothetical protein
MSNLYLRRYLAGTHSPRERARARMLAWQHPMLAVATVAWQKHLMELLYVRPWVVQLKGRVEQLEAQVGELRGLVGQARGEVQQVRTQAAEQGLVPR